MDTLTDEQLEFVSTTYDNCYDTFVKKADWSKPLEELYDMLALELNTSVIPIVIKAIGGFNKEVGFDPTESIVDENNDVLLSDLEWDYRKIHRKRKAERERAIAAEKKGEEGAIAAEKKGEEEAPAKKQCC
jgi:hypothetical protein